MSEPILLELQQRESEILQYLYSTVCHDFPSASEDFHASRVPLLVLDSWIQVGVEEVDEQVGRHDHGGKEEVDPGDQRVVPVGKRIDHQPSQARDGKHLLHDHRAADEDRQLQTDERHHRDQRVLDGVPEDDQALSESLGPGCTDVILPEHLQHHRAGHAHRARCQIGPQDQTRSDEHTEVGEGVVANASEPQRRRPAPPDPWKDEDDRGQPEVGRGQSEDGEGAAHVVAQGVLLDCRVNPDGHSDQQTDEDRHQTQLDGDQ